ncbi:MAG TPA: isochorismatase family protein [Bryobacteraceae bacterium]|nr:isochorismatase family protein [Bryobacteraceae bacterium]HPT27067.1 isochorismatase family protein [Bryobacteraceae bacterium]
MKTVFFDVDTQYDFMTAAGALAVPRAGRLIPVVGALNQWAWDRGAPVVSTTDAHAENDAEFKIWPAHCVAGTWGQLKPAPTLHGGRMLVQNRAAAAIPDAPQYLVEKQTNDCFTNVNLPALLERLGAERYVVYGVVTEYCVRCALMGLLGTGRRVEVVTDAIETLNPADSAKTLAEFVSAGGHLVRMAEILA